jgi:radical SAM superfamily enzyme YgiQ (UPF0313 family)
MPSEDTIIRYFNCISDYDYLGDSDVEPNYGLFSIAAYVRQECQKKDPKFSIKYVDLNIIDQKLRKTENRQINANDIEEVISRYSCQIVGISFMTSSYGTWANILIPIVVKWTSAPIFLGGIHPTVRYRKIMKELKELKGFNNIKGIIVGEGEKVFYKIVNEMLYERGNLQEIEHLCTPEKFNHDPDIRIEPARLSNIDLSNLPAPAYDIFYEQNDEIIARVYSSRGCNSACSMCSVGRFFRTTNFETFVPINPNSLIDNIGKLHELHNVKHFVLGDLNISDRSLLEPFLEKLILLNQQKNIRKHWWCQTRGDSSVVDLDMAKLLIKAGFKQIAIGCEGATNEQLKWINKKQKVNSVKKALTTLTNAGLSTQGYWIIGLPYDNKESIRQTQGKILEYLQAGIIKVPHITILVPYPGTDLERHQGSNGIRILNDIDYKDYWMNCDLYGCGKPIYETIDRNGKTLLKRDQIYELWLETLQKVTCCINQIKKG